MNEQLTTMAAGVLLLTAALVVWRHSVAAAVRLLAVQGAALAVLVVAVGARAHDAELLTVAALVLGVKAVALPWVLARGAGTDDGGADEPRANAVTGLMAVALLTALAYAVSGRFSAAVVGASSHVVPVGIALVLIGFLLLATRRRAVSQLVGFLVLDNGIATVAFLTAGGVPLVVELGVSLDVVLVVLVLRILQGRMHTAFGGTDVTALRELRD